LLKPEELTVPEDKFKAQFGKEWKDVLAAGQASNAMDALQASIPLSLSVACVCGLFVFLCLTYDLQRLNISVDVLTSEWVVCMKKKTMVKLGGGFYCGLIEVVLVRATQALSIVCVAVV